MKEIDKAKDSLRMIAYRDDPRSNNLIVELTDVMTILDELKSDLLHSVSDCTSTLEDTIDLIEHTSRVLDAYKEKGIVMKVLDKRVKAKLNYLHKLYSR